MVDISLIKINKKIARQFLLTYQGLLPPRKLRGKKGVLQYIKRVKAIQFDPLNRVGRNPDLVLQSRVSDYQPQLLKELLYQDRKLIDGWDKNMSIYQITDWPFFTRNRVYAKGKCKDAHKKVNAVLAEIREELKTRGPLSSIELNFDKKVEWSWSPTRLARAALESMYSWGELLVHHKIGTRKVYGFTKKYLSDKLLSSPDPNISDDQYYAWYVKRRIAGIGLLKARAGDAWLGIRGLKSKERNKAFEDLLKQGDIIPVQIEDCNDIFYISNNSLQILKEVNNFNLNYRQAAFLAPLDNLLWDRQLIREIFDFAYVWEVYKPAADREYGYYVLPVLYGDSFIARFEPTFDKNKKELLIKNWWWEPGITPSQTMENAIRIAFKKFAQYLTAERIIINKDAGGDFNHINNIEI